MGRGEKEASLVLQGMDLIAPARLRPFVLLDVGMGASGQPVMRVVDVASGIGAGPSQVESSARNPSLKEGRRYMRHS